MPRRSRGGPTDRATDLSTDRPCRCDRRDVGARRRCEPAAAIPRPGRIHQCRVRDQRRRHGSSAGSEQPEERNERCDGAGGREGDQAPARDPVRGHRQRIMGATPATEGHAAQRDEEDPSGRHREDALGKPVTKGCLRLALKRDLHGEGGIRTARSSAARPPRLDERDPLHPQIHPTSQEEQAAKHLIACNHGIPQRYLLLLRGSHRGRGSGPMAPTPEPAPDRGEGEGHVVDGMRVIGRDPQFGLPTRSPRPIRMGDLMKAYCSSSGTSSSAMVTTSAIMSAVLAGIAGRILKIPAWA